MNQSRSQCVVFQASMEKQPFTCNICAQIIVQKSLLVFIWRKRGIYIQINREFSLSSHCCIIFAEVGQVEGWLRINVMMIDIPLRWHKHQPASWPTVEECKRWKHNHTLVSTFYKVVGKKNIDTHPLVPSTMLSTHLLKMDWNVSVTWFFC